MRLLPCFTRSFSTVSPTAHNFSFSGCGFLIPYHLGVAQGLQDAGFIQADSKFAGASGGAIAALSLAANSSMSDIHEETKAMARLCHNEGTIWKLEERLRAIFHTKFGDLPVETLAQRLTIATEKMWPARAMVLTDAFHSTDDLCDALIASCYIPWYLAKRGTSVFRGEYHVDGGLLTLVPEVPGYTKVCAFHAHMLRRDDYEISPSIDPDFPFPIMQLARFALFPPQVEVLDQLFRLGIKSANIWAEKQASERNVK
ncbi:Patatin-like phosphoLipase [Phytophthora palmivora]|uniref:Patatin-like phosphoLipase n=1 Tax=Phytophthora palmivora TaxID=4796 RepID=A0A2P4WWG0_9STRA|nr:Patatin-like phosphoLipase [Phytophthora palmivora]